MGGGHRGSMGKACHLFATAGLARLSASPTCFGAQPVSAPNLFQIIEAMPLSRRFLAYIVADNLPGRIIVLLRDPVLAVMFPCVARASGSGPGIWPY